MEIYEKTITKNIYCYIIRATHVTLYRKLNESMTLKWILLMNERRGWRYLKQIEPCRNSFILEKKSNPVLFIDFFFLIKRY